MLDVSREIILKLTEYKDLVLKWNKTINLISPYTEDNIWERHILDSLQLIKFIEDKNIHLVDLGSGAGFPGVVLSIAGVKKVTLIESDTRKVAFLLQACSFSSNKIEILNQRVENVCMKCDVVTSRGFAELSHTLQYSKNIQTKKYLFLKGQSYEQELDKVLFNCIIHDSITSEYGKILEIRLNHG